MAYEGVEGQGMTLQEPENISLDQDTEDDKGVSYILEELHEGNTMLDQVTVDLEKAGLNIVTVERLTNSHLKKKYITERDLLLEQRSDDADFKLNEKYLYHGTTANKMTICEEGLDHRMSKQGCFGKGIYFSDYPRKCLKYAEKGGSDDTSTLILLVRVIRGDVKTYPGGEKDKTLVREPEKTQPYTGFRYYDSVEGCPVNHREFVVYESRRALVECIITYRRSVNQSAPGDPETASTNLQEGAKSSTPTRPGFEDPDTSSDSDDDEQDKVSNVTSSSDDNAKYWSDGASGASSCDDEAQDENNSAPLEDGTTDINMQTNEVADRHLQKMEQEFTQKTQVTDKHLIDIFLLSANLNVDKAVKLYNEKGQRKKEDPNNEFVAKLEADIKTSTIPENIDPQPWKDMNAADQEAATKCCIENFLNVIGKDKEDDGDKILAKKYLEATEMNVDEAIISYLEEM